jgi:hypothetical protein
MRGRRVGDAPPYTMASFHTGMNYNSVSPHVVKKKHEQGNQGLFMRQSIILL